MEIFAVISMLGNAIQAVFTGIIRSRQKEQAFINAQYERLIRMLQGELQRSSLEIGELKKELAFREEHYAAKLVKQIEGNRDDR